MEVGNGMKDTNETLLVLGLQDQLKGKQARARCSAKTTGKWFARGLRRQNAGFGRSSERSEGFRGRRVSSAAINIPKSDTPCVARYTVKKACHQQAFGMMVHTCSREVTVASRTKEKLALLCPTAIV